MDSIKIVRKNKEAELKLNDLVLIQHRNGIRIEGRVDGIREDRITLDCSRRYGSWILHLEYEEIRKVLFVNGEKV